MTRFPGSHLWLLLIALLLGGCEPAHESPGEGFAGLGREQQGYAPVVPGRELSFPTDHAAHPEFRIEWWYVTANLKDQQGRDWGAQWTLFRQALQPHTETSPTAGWGQPQVWLGHAALTQAQGHRHAERLARGGVGQAGVELNPYRAWIDHWQLSGQANAMLSPLWVQAQGENFGYRLELHSDRPVVLQGEQGYSRKSDSDQASYYYSQPFYQVSGEIEWDGERLAVSGQGWLDREWSSQPLAEDQQGWDWFSLHLDSGDKLMLFRLRSEQRGHYLSGTWISATGQTWPLVPEAVEIEPLNQVSVAGRQIPTRWRLRVAVRDFEVTTEALNPQAWMGTGIPYWEGPIRVSGSHAGVGYLEMTGY